MTVIRLYAYRLLPNGFLRWPSSLGIHCGRESASGRRARPLRVPNATRVEARHGRCQGNLLTKNSDPFSQKPPEHH